MQTIQVALNLNSYPIYIGSNILAKQEVLAPHIHGQQVLIVTQKNIDHLYLKSIEENLAGYQCDVLLLADGEQYKNVAEWQKIVTALLQKKHDRSTTLIALGGGVVGDITGFAAACYQRGVNYIQIPTTLIAQVDSAIGGKTGVNHFLAKNMLGAFYQPQCVIADIDTLRTLPAREYIAGLAEVIKYGLICDAEFFSWLEKNIYLVAAKEPEALLHIVTTCAAYKAAIVAEDERDQGGRRQLLNFGHTFGHALETICAYQTLLHGEAVAIGMMMAAEISAFVNGLSAEDVERIRFLLNVCGLPVHWPKQLQSIELVALMKRDKKNQNGKIKLVLLEAIGRANSLDSISEESLVAFLNSCHSPSLKGGEAAAK